MSPYFHLGVKPFHDYSVLFCLCVTHLLFLRILHSTDHDVFKFLSRGILFQT